MKHPRGTTLAVRRVVLCRSCRARRVVWCAFDRTRRGARAFTLVELMVVVAIISIVAVLAIPTMNKAQVDRRVVQDAGYVSQLFRVARTRAVGRGAAVLVDLSATQTGGAGRFAMYEAVTTNPNGAGGLNELPVSTCKSPTLWPGNGGVAGTNYEFVDAVDLSGQLEQQVSIGAQILDPSGAPIPSGAHVFLCFTPGGRVYYAASTPVFDAATPLNGALQIQVRRYSGSFATPLGLTRTVWVASSGSIRVVSQ